MSDCQRKFLPPKLLLISKHPTGKEVDKNDKMLPDEIQELVNTDKITKFMYYEKTTRLPACFMVHMKEFLSDFNCYELFYVNH